jgi:hypothetical protein
MLRLIFLKFILRAADISNLEFFKVISLPLFTTFLAIQPLFKTVLKILTSVKMFFTNYLMSKKRFPFSIFLHSGNSQKSAGAKSGKYG